MNKLDRDYKDLIIDILTTGREKETRNGKVTSVFSRQIRHQMKDGFPLLTTKRMPFKTIATELLWFLQGRTDLRYLLENNCHIWDGDAYKNYLASPLATIHDFRSNELYQNLYSGWCVLEGRSFIAPHPTRHLTYEEFIEKIKTDDVFAERWGDLGPIYGSGWRNWNGRKTDGFVEYEQNGYDKHIKGIDQIQTLINDLKTNPDSRRLMVSAWNVGELDKMVLPPCHYAFQVYTRELSHEERFRIHSNNPIAIQAALDNKPLTMEETNTPTRAISLMWNQRSVDVPLGLPFNIASYGLLLMIIAKEVNMIPEELIGNLGDCHIYKNQEDGVTEQIGRLPYSLPNVRILDKDKGEDCLPTYSADDFILSDYTSHPKLEIPLSN